MSEMVDRIARALCAYCSGPDVIDPCPSWDQISEIERNEWRGEARAALAAMREPTEAMAEAGENNHGSCDGYTDMAEVYRAMIDAALSQDG